MKRFDYELFLKQYERKHKICLILFILLCVVTISLFALGIIISNFFNQTVIMISFSIALAILVIVCVSVFLFGVEKYRNEKKQIFYLLGSYLSFHEGKVVKIGREITTLSGRKGIEVFVLRKNGEIVLYFDPIFEKIPFKTGDNVKIKSSESFIIQYEVTNE